LGFYPGTKIPFLGLKISKFKFFFSSEFRLLEISFILINFFFLKKVKKKKQNDKVNQENQTSGDVYRI
jgi:hypothetical protein